MRDVLGRLGAFAGALLMVAGVIGVASFVIGLLSGRVSFGGLLVAVVGAALIAGVARLGRVPSLLGGYSALVYVGLFLPIVIVVIYAFNSGRYVTVWGGFSTASFSRALHDDAITSSILRSFRIGLTTSLVSTLLGTAAALALARARAGVRTPAEVVILLTVVVPEVVIAIATLVFFVNVGFELGTTTMFLGHCVFNMSLVTLIVRARFLSMGDSLEEASRDLGAGPISTFWQVTLPRLAPAILAGGLLAFTFSFDDVVISNFTSGAGHETWPLHILSALRFGLTPTLNAAATLMIGVTLVGLALAALALRIGSRQGAADLSTSTT
ncbi:MAG: spermidine/putrescine transport system permease protein [Baekduia sp.]|jgi:spermidine/putrescine transport system permease protein/putrescine transport system permease protein|nr:spermidine/putrescine transport system permease protein [Baekduia sp.]